jgi:hypothetical protein
MYTLVAQYTPCYLHKGDFICSESGVFSRVAATRLLSTTPDLLPDDDVGNEQQETGPNECIGRVSKLLQNKSECEL